MNIENLHKGDWVTIIRDLQDYDVLTGVSDLQPMSGEPALVLAISPPFVAVQTVFGRAVVDNWGPHIDGEDNPRKGAITR